MGDPVDRWFGARPADEEEPLRVVGSAEPYDGVKCGLVLEVDRNPDWLPRWLCPTEGCPECRSAYAEVDTVLLPVRRREIGIITDDRRAHVLSFDGLFAKESERSVGIVGVELLCLEGHRVRYTGAPYPIGLTAGTALGAIAVAGLALFASTKTP